MALAGTVFFLLRLLIVLFSGATGRISGDLADMRRAEKSFSPFSLLPVLAFFLGAGWTGLICRVQWGQPALVSIAAAAGAGCLVMLAASALLTSRRRN